MVKKELIISKYIDKKGNEFIQVRTSDNILIRRFKYNPNRVNIQNFHTEKEASEISIKNYFAERHLEETGEELKPTSKKEAKEKIKVFIEKDKETKTNKKIFDNQNRLIFTGQRKVKNFDYMYINAQVKIFFDGHFTIVSGRSNYVYGKQIQDSQINYYIKQAVIRAIAPYGSNVSFKPVKWSFVYHQQKYNDFDKI